MGDPNDDSVLLNMSESERLLTPEEQAAVPVPAAPAATSSSEGAVTPGELVVLLATFIYAVQSVCSKVVERRVPSMEVVLVRSLTAGAITLASLITKMRRASLASGEPLDWTVVTGQQKHWPLLLLRGVSGCVAFSLNYTALPFLEIGDHTAIFFLHPVFTALLSWPVLQEKVGASDIPAALLGLMGTLLIVRPPVIFAPLGLSAADGTAEAASATKGPRWAGVVMQICAAFFCSCAMLSVRKIGKREAALVMSMWFHTVSSAGGAQPFIVPTASEAALLLFIAATSFWGQLALTWSYQMLPAAYSAGLSYLQVVWGYVVGILLLHEPLEALSTLGAALISGAGISNAVTKARRAPASLASSASTLVLQTLDPSPQASPARGGGETTAIARPTRSDFDEADAFFDEFDIDVDFDDAHPPAYSLSAMKQQAAAIEMQRFDDSG